MMIPPVNNDTGYTISYRDAHFQKNKNTSKKQKHSCDVDDEDDSSRQCYGKGDQALQESIP